MALPGHYGGRVTNQPVTVPVLAGYSLAKTPLLIGIMSGTSMDGVDAVLARMVQGKPEQVASSFAGFDDSSRRELIALNSPGPDEIHRAALAANHVADLYAEVVAKVLAEARVKPGDIAAIGAHGQTVRHRPHLGYTVQLLNGARLAERTGIKVVCDFRSRDIAAGGEGAPLVPAFHAAIFSDPGINRVMLNLGGIANVTALSAGGNNVFGFDTGPANVLMDYWCEKHAGRRYDENGAWAAGGAMVPELLAAMLAEPFFHAAPPKSTGRDLLSPQWLAQFGPERFAAADVQATLLALTVRTVADNILAHIGRPDDVLACGGGALNGALMAGLAQALAPARVMTTDNFGVDPMSVEALAFAWLAWRTLEGLPGNLPSATGAMGERVLGAVYG